ncbi:toll/interleukin-1 receptor domain-containing protein [Sphaerisporangium dianthi]|uniref:Toll/interleukin-1 receptor domain-containing protein n=1 Tax=Sphaerisporangium dianthi TaxID=1436120 RepID=A0ABV9CGA4_9ACTN
MFVPLRDRPYQLFISYAHEERKFVVALAAWLAQVADVRIWWDEDRLPVASSVSYSLPEAMGQARGIIIVVSRASVRSGWVREECAAAIGQRAADPAFRILAVKIDDVEIPKPLETTVYINMPESGLTAETAYRLLCALHTDATTVSPKDANDLYVSRTWRSSESGPADEICSAFAGSGYRLVGDSIDQQRADRATRVGSIIRSCGALLAIMPLRDARGRTSPYILEEVGIAQSLGLPYLLVADPGVVVPEGLTEDAMDGRVYRTDELANFSVLAQAVDAVREYYEPPRTPDYAFYAGSLSNPANEHVCGLIRAVTGMDCVMGQYLHEQQAQRAIIERISHARFVVADVSEDNRNALIEAGIARGANRPLILMAHGRPQPSRFMFRDLETNFYEDEVEMLGKLYRLVHPYRKRILNYELG